MIFSLYALQDRRAFPEESGVYAVVLNGECLYAGETCNFKKRWQSHKLIPVIRQNPQARVLFSPMDEQQRKRAESWLIWTFTPLFNEIGVWKPYTPMHSGHVWSDPKTIRFNHERDVRRKALGGNP